MSPHPHILAAGAVVLRNRNDVPEVLVVHRPRYDDWSLPKGKLERGETDAVCAVREVAEETGVRIHLRAPLSPHRYLVKNKLKQVDWWLAEAIDGQAGDVMDLTEVDRVEWWSTEEATERLSYGDERDRLVEAIALPPVTPLLILRHAKALPRKQWRHVDSERPITDWGHRQARSVMPFLAAFGVRRVISSTSTRCLQTVDPYARALELPLESWPELTEETFEQRPKAAGKATAALAAETARAGVPTVACGHRPVLPSMLAAIDAPAHNFATAEALVLALRADGTPAAARPVAQRVGR